MEEWNVQLGTNYAFPTAKQMDNNEKNNIKTEVSDIIEYESEISPQTYTKKQKYYYDITGKNYLFINSTAYTADGKERYSGVDSYGYKGGAYPYYKPNSMSNAISDGFMKVTCTFSCVKYTAQNLITATKHTVKVTIKASGGDVYTTVLV